MFEKYYVLPQNTGNLTPLPPFPDAGMVILKPLALQERGLERGHQYTCLLLKHPLIN